jgi:hypothetical protein
MRDRGQLFLIAYLAVCAGCATGATVVEAIRGHEVGMSLGVGLTIMLFGQTVDRIGRLRSARSRRVGQEAKRRASERAAHLDERNTGRWRSPEGRVCVVRWDPVGRVYFVDGEPWTDREVLMRYLEMIEGWGWAADDGPSTRAIRARLDMPGWWASVNEQ